MHVSKVSPCPNYSFATPLSDRSNCECLFSRLIVVFYSTLCLKTGDTHLFEMFMISCQPSCLVHVFQHIHKLSASSYITRPFLLSTSGTHSLANDDTTFIVRSIRLFNAMHIIYSHLLSYPSQSSVLFLSVHLNYRYLSVIKPARSVSNYLHIRFLILTF